MALNEADPAQGCTIGGGQGEGVGARLRKVPGPWGLAGVARYIFLLSCQCSLALLLRTSVWEGLVTLKRRLAGTFDVALCNVNGYSLNPPKASSFILGGHSCVLPCSVWSVESGNTFASALKSSLNLRILLTLCFRGPSIILLTLPVSSECGLCLCADSSEVFQHQTLDRRGHVHHRCDMELCMLDRDVAGGAVCGVCVSQTVTYCPTWLSLWQGLYCWAVECSHQIYMRYH